MKMRRPLVVAAAAAVVAAKLNIVSECRRLSNKGSRFFM
jgi:hypothetical protein